MTGELKPFSDNFIMLFMLDIKTRMIYCVELIRHYKHINNLFSFNGDLEVTKTVSLKTVVATYEKFYGWYLRPENGGDLCFIIRKIIQIKTTSHA